MTDGRSTGGIFGGRQIERRRKPDGDEERGFPGDRRAGPGAVLRHAPRIWAVAAVHGEAGRLADLHDGIAGRLRPDDGIVYLGDVMGHGPAVGAALDELLQFRLAFLARPPYVSETSFVCLRGRQEEMWQKLLQIQFAPNPLEVIDWMLDHGVGATIAAYGGDPDEARTSARDGPLALTRWTGDMRERMRRRSGHAAYLDGLRMSARTEDAALLFVNAGIDPTRSYANQTDGFWWDSAGFESIDAPYAGFRLIVRGLDPRGGGFARTPWSLTIDAGCRLGGPLLALCLTPEGEICDRVEA